MTQLGARVENLFLQNFGKSSISAFMDASIVLVSSLYIFFFCSFDVSNVISQNYTNIYYMEWPVVAQREPASFMGQIYKPA